MPRFGDGDVDRLACRIVDQGGQRENGSWLVVEVENRGAVAAEPVVFAIAPSGRDRATGDERRTSRGRLPDLRRFGRPVAPGQKQRFWLRTSVPGDRKKLQARVVEACFHDGPPVPEPAGLVGAIDHVQRESMIGTFPVPLVKLHNPLDRDLDVLMLVTLSQPRDGVELFGARIAAGKTLDWVLWSVPYETPFLDTDGAPAGPVRATKIDVVDWLLVGDPDADAGARRFAAAYEPWLRWAEPRPTVQGSFELRGRQLRVNSTEYDPLAASGGFTLHPDGKLVLEASGTTGDAEQALRAAFADLLRKSTDEVLKGNRCLPITADRVELHGAGFTAEGPSPFAAGHGASAGGGERMWYELGGGQIVGCGWGPHRWQRWQTLDVGNGYLVARREQEDGKVFEQFSWAQIDGRWMPVAWQSSTTYGAQLFRDVSLHLADLRVTGAVAAPVAAPAGDGVDALRALWDGAPHVATAPLELTAQVEVRTPGTDWVWAGNKKVEGTLHLRGIGRSCRQLTLDTGGRLGEEAEHTLAAAIFDRFGIWFARDFNDRPAFDELFDGTRIDAADPGGVFHVHDGPVLAVHAKGDRIVRVIYRNGRDLTFTHGKLGALEVVTTARDHIGTTKVTLQVVDGHLLPARLHFEHIYDREWGPETITLRNLKVH
ncbi:MAG: hypothetical protein H6835_02740 [Planctomycetes bacterium]|nr:hypothetical protein [Planctomycetota bacterium]